ncbi:MAG TPA: heavy metal translocating P-type ATPase [Chloroflexota bacterium]|nr:heavy metal translocating P-type ATPase [Chloroflexota bacterium]
MISVDTREITPSPEIIVPLPTNPDDHTRKRVSEARLRRTMAVLTSINLVTLVGAWLISSTGSAIGSIVLPLVVIAYLAGGGFSAAKALDQLRRGKFTIDLLMVTAALGAASVGAWAEGGVLLFLFSLSNTLEKFALHRTRQAIETLLDLRPPEAVVIRDGRDIRIPTTELVIGDIVVVRPGERIPADGVVVVGASSVDQSPMTGESIPVDKAAGDSVFAGTLNGEGSLELRSTRPANDTTLQRIIRLVEVAQSEKAESQRFTDWFGTRYTIGVFIAAILATLLPRIVLGEALSISFYRAMTLLVVASPCAIVISIPAAILSAIARGARSGILFKGGAHLERAAKITAVGFDKTGTLTLGRPVLSEVRAVPGVETNTILQLAASAEARSEHPLARAIVDGAKAKNINLLACTSLAAIVGHGIEARIDGRLVWIGKKGLLELHGLVVPDTLLREARELAASGQTVIYVGDEAGVLGLVAAADTLRPYLDEALNSLRRLGINRLVMLTGDNSTVAATMASRLGIDYKADMLPVDKMVAIEELLEKGEFVAMVGDGINDAPSLAAATLGVSLGGTSTDVALETADLVLMGSDLRRLPEAIGLARAMNQIVRQNLIFAFSVMIILLISTFALSLRLPFAVVGHEGSTVLVILNGLRLLAYRSKPA